MKNTIISLTILLFTNLAVRAQMFEELKEEPYQNLNKFYIGAYVGSGLSINSFSLPTDTFTVAGQPEIFKQPITILLLNVFAGTNFLFNHKSGKIGVGINRSQLMGKTNNVYFEDKVNTIFYKIHLRNELKFISSKNGEFGMSNELGTMIISNPNGIKPSTPIFVNLGMYFDFPINEKTIFYLDIGIFEYARYNSTITQYGNYNTSQNFFNYDLDLGIRFGF